MGSLSQSRRGVTFVGLVPYEQMFRWVRDDVDIIIHPLLDEVFLAAVLESMTLTKLGIAGKNTPGIRVAIRGGGGEVLADVCNNNSIAHAMISLMAEPHLSSACAARRGIRMSRLHIARTLSFHNTRRFDGAMPSSMKRNLPNRSHYPFLKLLSLDDSRSSQCC